MPAYIGNLSASSSVHTCTGSGLDLLILYSDFPTHVLMSEVTGAPEHEHDQRILLSQLSSIFVEPTQRWRLQDATAVPTTANFQAAADPPCGRLPEVLAFSFCSDSLQRMQQ